MKSVILTVILCTFFISVNASAKLSLSSSQIKENRTMQARHRLNGFGCKGENISPELSWSGEPSMTKSFALTLYDPDAPTGSGWHHWVVFNIPKTMHSLPENSGNPESGLLPDTIIQSRTDFGTRGYGGACPPVGDGEHRYRFTLWALDVEKLDLDNQASGAMVGYFR